MKPSPDGDEPDDKEPHGRWPGLLYLWDGLLVRMVGYGLIAFSLPLGHHDCFARHALGSILMVLAGHLIVRLAEAIEETIEEDDERGDGL